MKKFERLYRTTAVIGGALLFVVCIMITADVLKRWLTGRPFLGVLELSEVGLVAMTFLSLAYMQNSDRQLRVDFISARLRGRSGQLLNLLDAALGLLFFSLMLYTSADKWWGSYVNGLTRRGMMVAIPSTVHLGFLVFGSALMCLSLITGGVSIVNRLVAGNELLQSGQKE